MKLMQCIDVYVVVLCEKGGRKKVASEEGEKRKKERTFSLFFPVSFNVKEEIIHTPDANRTLHTFIHISIQLF